MRLEADHDPALAAVGHHFVLGLEKATRLTEHDQRLLTALRPAGVVLFRENFAHGRPYLEWLRTLDALIGHVRDAVGREQLLVGIDHEGGRVLRTPAPLTAFAAPRVWRERAGEVGRAMGRELRSIGCNVDFAPVVDVDSNPANPIIGDRAFAPTPEAVVGPARAFLAALEAEGVTGCLKHFPGHGDTSADSHHTLPSVDVDLPMMRRRELAPFAELAREARLLMTAHVLYPRVDATQPATLSRRFLSDILRDELGFAGVVISDDLGMRAVAERMTAPGAAAGTIAAGCDLLLVCAHLTDTAVALALARELLAALDDGSLDSAREEASARRVADLLAALPQHAVEPLAEEVFTAHRTLLAGATGRARVRAARGAPMPTLVMIVDDEPGILTTLAGVLGDEGYETVATASGEQALALYRERQPDVVLLDVWLPDRDGLETLEALRELDPTAAVVMMSGHGTTATAAKAIKMGAVDYVEKPLSYGQAVEAVEGALAFRAAVTSGTTLRESLGRPRTRLEVDRRLEAPPPLPQLAVGREPERTLRGSTVLYGLGLHSGSRTGMALQPLPPGTGIHFVTLPTHTYIPGHVDAVADTDYATTLSRADASIRTVEHLLSALHARGVTNLLIKVHGEIPVLDGSALEFCNVLDEVGVEEQGVARRELVIDRRYEVSAGEKRLTIEPYDGFAVSYDLSYPPPVGEQTFDFELASWEAYREEVAPARTFGFLRDLAMMAELGLGSGGRLDNCVLVGEEGIVNTRLRFPDELARHKVLDIIGDLYLLGYPIRGRVRAHLTGHKMNIALLREIQRGRPS